MSNALITIDFFPAGSDQKRLRPITAKLAVTDQFRQAALKLGWFSKQVAGDEHIDVICHDARVATMLASSLREAAVELEAAAAKSANPFGK